MSLMSSDKKIAITGLASSGKTVFLLSLLQQLKFAVAEGDFLNRKGEILRYTELPFSNSQKETAKKKQLAFEPFPVEQFRYNLMAFDSNSDAVVEWPKKTKDLYRYRVSFQYTGRRLFQNITLDFLDFPGERLADAEIARQADFADWSDHLLTSFRTSPSSAEIVEGYIKECRSITDLSAGLKLYKSFLSSLLVAKNQLITPSSFMLDCISGSVFKKNDHDDKGASRVCGLPDKEFFPLPKECRSNSVELVKSLADHYSNYRAQIVAPLFESFNECDQLLFLVDIPFILNAGVHRYNDTVAILEAWKDILKPSKWYNPFSHLKKVAFICTKADLVSKEDDDQLCGLLHEMGAIVRKQHPELKLDAFVTSAWISTEEISPHVLTGKRSVFHPDETDEQRNAPWFVTPVPNTWPTNWKKGEYSYPRVEPEPLKNRSKPPKQYGMNGVFAFIIG